MLPFMLIAIAQTAVEQNPPSPYTLPIGREGQTVVESGRITDLKTGKPASVDDIAKAADRKLFVFLGEEHATEPDQLVHAAVIEALVRRGRHVVVGLEMYQRPKQTILDQWSAGQVSEADFLAKSDWKGQWGYDFAFYRPVFDAIQRYNLPLIGLNIPRDWVRAVGKGGFDALKPEDKAQLPADMSLDNGEHKKVFDSLMGGHAMSPNIYSAQVLWDEAMADTALKYLSEHRPSSRTVFVVIAGSGHVMYRQGINYRIAKRKGGDGITVVMLDSNEPVPVSNGLADFVLVSPSPRAK
jgi:uncharacterized iron-regulated protein